MFDQILIKSSLHLITGLPAKIQISVTAKFKLKIRTFIIKGTEEGLTTSSEGLLQNTAAPVLIRKDQSSILSKACF